MCDKRALCSSLILMQSPMCHGSLARSRLPTRGLQSCIHVHDDARYRQPRTNQFKTREFFFLHPFPLHSPIYWKLNNFHHRCHDNTPSLYHGNSSGHLITIASRGSAMKTRPPALFTYYSLGQPVTLLYGYCLPLTQAIASQYQVATYASSCQINDDERTKICHAVRVN